MIRIQITGADALRKTLQGFSDRRFNAALATGLTRTAKKLAGDWQQQIDSAIDRPVPRTKSATRFTGASANALQATVAIKDQTGSGMAPVDYLAQHQYMGSRLIKKFEQALIASGAMPAGYYTVPGRYATRDSYGNISRSLIIAVISQLGADFSPGYQQTISRNTARRLASQARHGRRYLVIKPGAARLSPGVYERMADRSLRSVFLFRSSVRYGKRLSLIERATQDAPAMLNQEVSAAIQASAARLQASRGGAT